MRLTDVCKLYVKAGIAYENGEDPMVTDNTWDEISKMLLNKYFKLPKWFTKKVTQEDLETGSASGFKERFNR